MKKIFIFLLSFLLIVTPVYQVESASIIGSFATSTVAQWLAAGFFSSIGGAAGYDLFEFVKNWLISSGNANDANITTVHYSESGQEYGGGHGKYFGVDDSGNLHVHAELLQELTAAMQEKVKALNGYYIFDDFSLVYQDDYSETFASSIVSAFFDEYGVYPSIVTDYYVGNGSSNGLSYRNYLVYWNKYGLVPSGTSNTWRWYHGTYDKHPEDQILLFARVYFKSGIVDHVSLYGPLAPSNYNGCVISLSQSRTCSYFFGPVKLFYSDDDYLLYKQAVEGGQEPPVYYYAPQYSGGDIVVNNKVYNNYANGTYNDADLQKKLDDILHQLEQDKGDTFDNLNESDRQYIVDHLFELYLQTLGDEDQWTGQEPETDPKEPETSPSGGGGGDSGGSGIDYTEILEQILAACKNTDNNIAQLLALFREFSGREGCQYDFGELKTYLEKVFADNHSDLAALQDRLDSSNAYLDTAVQRLDSIYERLGGFADYTEILDAIYDAISGGEYSLDDLVRALDAFASANHTDLDAILTAIQTSNRYFELLLGRLPKSFAESYDDTDLLEVLDEMLDELVINNDYNEKILKQLENIYDFMTQESFMKHVQDKARQCADKASEVFPTSIPWDMARLVNALAAKPETPVITVPIHVESLGVEESFTVDLHFFDEYAGKFRTVVVVLFAAGLMGLTITIFKDKFF